jgi:hypothetical protein
MWLDTHTHTHTYIYTGYFHMVRACSVHMEHRRNGGAECGNQHVLRLFQRGENHQVCVCVYVCMYVCVCVYVCVYLFMYIHICSLYIYAWNELCY